MLDQKRFDALSIVGQTMLVKPCTRASWDLGKRLIEERKRLGLLAWQLANIGGVTPTHQEAYERGTQSPTAAYLETIARDAGIDVLYVLTGRHEVGQPNA